MTFPLQFAEKAATKIADELTPFCDRIEIAGSIRRRRPMVGDIDLVVLPKPGQLEALKDRCKLHAFTRTDGDQNLIVELKLSNGDLLQVDIFIARPSRKDLFVEMPGNFGSLLLCRTGSTEHNIFLVQHAKSLGLVWNPYQGVYDPRFASRVEYSNCLASESEEEIFRALKLSFVRPEDRER